MSSRHVSQAWSADDLAPTYKLVLLAISDACNYDGVFSGDEVSRDEYLRSVTGISASQLERSINALVKGGHLSRTTTGYMVPMPDGSELHVVEHRDLTVDGGPEPPAVQSPSSAPRISNGASEPGAQDTDPPSTDIPFWQPNARDWTKTVQLLGDEKAEKALRVFNTHHTEKAYVDPDFAFRELIVRLHKERVKKLRKALEE